MRHDGGDAEIGTGVEVGCGVSYADPATGLSLEAKVRTLVAHADSGNGEWGASATARLDPGERGRGLSFISGPPWRESNASERFGRVRDARTLSAGGGAFRPGRVRRQMGYGMALFGAASPARPGGLGARCWRAMLLVGVWRRRGPD